MPSLSSAEKLFYDNVAYGWRMSKARAKPRVHNIMRWLKITPDEVVAKLKVLGVNITRRTLLNYEKDKLIPEPKRGGAGRGKGRTTDYPDETPAEFYASHTLRHGRGFRPDLIARSRKRALIMEARGGLGFIDWVLGKGATPETIQEAGLGQAWLKEKHRVLHENDEPCEVCRRLVDR